MSTNASLLMKKLTIGQLDHVLQEIYTGKDEVEVQCERYIRALNSFVNLYGDHEVEVYSAPGRTEIGGNHTDHQNGRVLAASVNLDAIAVVARRIDSDVVMKSEGYEPFRVNLNDLTMVSGEEGTTNALIRGVAACLKKRGYKIGGFDAYVTSDVLSGSGLSSSAAFEVLVGIIFSGLYNEGMISPVEIAKIGQEAENLYFGKPCGLMDQTACSVGGLVFIDFAEKDHPVIHKLNTNFQDFAHSLCIVDTKGSHADLTEEYAAIPYEMKQVAAYFGKEVLCQVDEEAFISNMAKIREKSGDRAVLRALHWFEENRRVDREVQALESGDFGMFLAAVKESGDSSYKYLQNIYAANNVREQNVSLALALSERILTKRNTAENCSEKADYAGCGVSRVHGGGFAGTIQAFVPEYLVEEYKCKMEQVFGEGACHVLQIRPIGGTRIL